VPKLLEELEDNDMESHNVQQLKLNYEQIPVLPADEPGAPVVPA
jgi:hypothetical protein